ncbi:Uncharacterized protein SVXHr_1576 [Halorhabdus sp. SVX81]|uniref:DUF5802 family protein n=1 Tax=Halorhabdus sp. SVX81 TaxID=2978283 RepID=UPI0027A191F1|nr:Uncharacterized protein SVXHr_1576 [Halorhabdus sp. SVX81]
MLLYSMFEPFSGAYYLGRLYVEPRDGETPAIARYQYESVRRQLYDPDAGGRDTPLVMKLDQQHFPVTGVESVPADTLAVPPEILSESQVEHPPSLREVLLATADRADQLLSLTSSVDPPDRFTGAPSGLRSDGGQPTGI